MQERNMTELFKAAFPGKIAISGNDDQLKKKIEAIADNNAIDIKQLNERKEKPDFFRSPSADELEQMRQFMIDYKKANRNASKREIRKATQKKFHVQIFRKPYKIKS